MVCELNQGQNNKKKVSTEGLKILGKSYQETADLLFSKTVMTIPSYLINYYFNFLRKGNFNMTSREIPLLVTSRTTFLTKTCLICFVSYVHLPMVTA